MTARWGFRAMRRAGCLAADPLPSGRLAAQASQTCRGREAKGPPAVQTAGAGHVR